MSRKREELDKYIGKRYILYYFAYEFGIWLLYFLYNDAALDEPSTTVSLILKSALYSAGTTIFTIFILKLIISYRQKRRSKKKKRRSSRVV